MQVVRGAVVDDLWHRACSSLQIGNRRVTLHDHIALHGEPRLALKSTVVKIELQVNDLDRHYYATHGLTIAQHPSETAERVMVRVLAFALNAAEDAVTSAAVAEQAISEGARREIEDGCLVGRGAGAEARRKFIDAATAAAMANLDIIEREGITNFTATPAITGDLVVYSRETGRHFPTLTAVGGGGASRAPEQVRAIDAVFDKAMPATGWGMTETNAIGVGIAAANIPRLFTQGFTTRKDGHGIGLHSASLAARNLGGSLRAASAGEGRGATFTLDLPSQATEAAA